MSKKLKHIELFAGCGGLSLGLEAVGYDLYFANELSPMASETFAHNILSETLEKDTVPKNVLWLKSLYPKNEIVKRLRENPFEASKGDFCDIDNKTDFKGKLLVGDINKLLDILKSNRKLAKKIRDEEIDLISGGPPCQSFSLAGKRKKDDHKNTLPLSFAQIAGLIKPKTVLLENVKGITAPFSQDGNKYYAWLEVSKAFVCEGFVPVCMMLNSKYFGVPQNRPRFILIAYRRDVFNSIFKKDPKNEILKISKSFYNKVRKNKNNLSLVNIEDFKYYDIESEPELFNGNILPEITHLERDFITTSEAIGDIRRTQLQYYFNKTKGKYANLLNEIFPKNSYENSIIQNHEPRRHSFVIKSRFRFYQVIEQFQNGLKKGAFDLFTGKDVSNEIRSKLLDEFSHHNLLFFPEKSDRETLMVPKDIEEVEELIKSIPTKKHSQRALKEFEPAPAQLTIPDDLCHYDSEQPRTLTVREMARFQSFPDWFEFKSKVTTGGQMRKFEVPQYTQVGNAVPPLLARVLGITIKKQLLELQKISK
ncbi:DNA (cytosine-5)-methyltransferase 1 [Saonia flava]|uniref:Cytosine-specific methyltransferase n=1 Tax=Saonia flava TaxID=523696 RepID=A0A846QXR2_9FLAO|nr:DNA cytosine methyltransferase [Saonia flava]NJB69894.1 DNA (cytosine-5)-methyltransferase 1 [Saonia flava]